MLSLLSAQRFLIIIKIATLGCSETIDHDSRTLLTVSYGYELTNLAISSVPLNSPSVDCFTA
jgi:hypothetical protein